MKKRSNYLILRKEVSSRLTRQGGIYTIGINNTSGETIIIRGGIF